MTRRSPAVATLDFVLTAQKDPVPLRPYQETIVQAAVEHLKDHERGQVIAACASGKTIMSMHIAQRLKVAGGPKRSEGRRILITAPTLTLLKQAMDDWQADYAGALRFAAVCSDKGVAEDIGRDELGLEPTTEAAALREFLAQPVPKRTTLVVLATYQSSPILAEAMHEASEVPSFDLLIADEAHRTAGEGAQSPFRTVLRGSELIGSIKADRRLFMTATPREITLTPRKRAPKDGRNELALEHAALYSMDDPKYYGEVIYELTMAEAIGQGIIADYRLVAFPMRKSLLARLTSESGVDGAPPSPLAGLEMEEAASAFALIKAVETYGMSHVITYHNRTRDAKAMAERLNWVTATGVGPQIEAATINGTMPMTARSEILSRFRERKRDGRVSVLTNAKALTEGVNVKAADGLVFADPKESLIEVVQALGRVLRKERPNDPKRATVLIPMVIDDTVPGRLVMDRTSSDRMRQTLTELKLVDAKVMDRLEVYPSLGEDGAATDTAAEEAAQVRASLQPTAKVSLRELVTLELAEQAMAVRPVAPRKYHNVFWSEAAKQWLACVRLQQPGREPEVLLDQLFDDAEEAAHAVDRVLNARGLDDWPRNFGRVTLPPPRLAAKLKTSDFDGVLYDETQEQWMGHVRVHVNGKVIAAVRYAETEEGAARARDALVGKYGLVVPLNFPADAPPYEAILLASESRTRRPLVRGVERDGVTGFWWAYATIGDAKRVVPIGFFLEEAEAKRVVVAVEERCALVGSDLALEAYQSIAQRVVQQLGVTPATYAKRRAAADQADEAPAAAVIADAPDVGPKRRGVRKATGRGAARG